MLNQFLLHSVAHFFLLAYKMGKRRVRTIINNTYDIYLIMFLLEIITFLIKNN